MDSRPETSESNERSEPAALRRALVELVASEGFTAATPAAVTERAGLPVEAFARQYHSVEDCFLSAYDEMVERLHTRVDEAIRAADAVPGSDGWRRQLEAGFGAALEFLAGDPALARACVVEVFSAGEPALARREAMIESFVACLDDLRIERDAPIPPLAPELIVRGTDDLVYARLARGESASLRELLPGLRYMWLVPFVGRYRATSAGEGGSDEPPSDDGS